MAVKSHLRNGRPVIVAISTNDGLGTAAENIGRLAARKNYYLVPFRQDDPHGKPNSLVADMERIPETLCCALNGNQIQPVIL
jgi:dipicolinate synthase subunit B